MMVVLGLMTVVAPAAAQDRFRQFYLGFGAGVAYHQDFCDNTQASSATPVTNCDDDANSFRGFAGYRLNRNLAFEVAYVGLGQATADAIGPGIGPLLPVRMKGKGWDYTGVLQFGLTDRLYGYGRLGAHTIRVWTDTYVANAPTITAAETTTGFTTGAGIGYDLGMLGFRAEWIRYLNVGGGSVPEDTIDVIHAGVLFRF